MTDKRQPTDKSPLRDLGISPFEALSFWHGDEVVPPQDDPTAALSLACYNVEGKAHHLTLTKQSKINGSHFIKTNDKRGDGIYHCVAGIDPEAKTPSKGSVRQINGVHADFDGVDQQEAFERLVSLPGCRPSMIVNSGRGVHAYWRFDTSIAATPETVDLVEKLNRILITKLGADPGCFNVDRRMRVPGTTHSKDKSNPLPCYVCDFEASEFDIDELEMQLTSLPDDPIKKIPVEKTAADGTKTYVDPALQYGELKDKTDSELREIITVIGEPLHPAIALLQSRLIGAGVTEDDVRAHIDELLEECPRQDRVAEGRKVGYDGLDEFERSLVGAVGKFRNIMKEQQRRAQMGSDAIPDAVPETETEAKAEAKTEKQTERQAKIAVDEEFAADPDKSLQVVRNFLEANQDSSWPGGDGQDGKPPPHNLPNVIAAVIRLGYEFRMNVRERIGEIRHPGSKRWQFKTDADENAVWGAVRLQMGIEKAKSGDVFLAISLLENENQYCAVREYLSALPKWDGAHRISGLFRNYFKADPEHSDEYLSAVSRVAAVGAVARAIHHGCDYQFMIILSGAQGCGKSSAIRTLFGVNESYRLVSESHIEWSNPQRVAEVMIGPWCVENAELSGNKYKETEAQKNAISASSDRVRLAYRRNAEVYERSAVLWGTTNETEIFTDATGSRRFLPVRVGEEGLVDRDALLRDRDQIWAEALVIYERQGIDAARLTDAEVAASRRDKREHEYLGSVFHVITEKIVRDRTWIGTYGIITKKGTHYVPWRTLVKDVLCIPVEKADNLSRYEQGLIRKGMEHLGFKSGVRFRTNDGQQVRGFSIDAAAVEAGLGGEPGDNVIMGTFGEG